MIETLVIEALLLDRLPLMARLLVSGGAGYIGSHTARALTDAGHEVIVIDDLRDGVASFAPGELVQISTGDRPALDALLTRLGTVDGALHFAASISVGESVTDPIKYWQNNTANALTFVAALIDHGVKPFVFSSTAAVYGMPESQPIPETATIDPINPYGASKAAVERLLWDCADAGKLAPIALRYFNACGAHPDGGIGEAHQPETHLVPLAIAAAAGDRDELKLFGTDYQTPDGTNVRDYIHVMDLASAHVIAVEALIAGHTGGAYNIGTGVGRSNREVLEAVGRGVGTPVPYSDAARRPGDPAELVADSTKFRAEFNWSPSFSDLDTVVATAWAWYQSQNP